MACAQALLLTVSVTSPKFCCTKPQSTQFYLFIYFWLGWVFTAAHGLSLVVVSGGYSSLWCAGFALQWLLS